MIRRTPPTTPEGMIERSISRYRRRHGRYERDHPDIFNPVEQRRLRTELEAALKLLERPVRALDFGCGSGNVTGHLLELGAEVVAADVSPEFLADVARRFAGRPVTTLRLDGVGLDGVDDGAFDIVCTYAVLHHIPDYAHAVSEICRALRPGGVAYLDHEADDGFYDRDGCFQQMVRELHPPRPRWRRALSPSTYVTRAIRLVNPAYPWDVEGDIHVWESDRIEWSLIDERLRAGGCRVVRRCDYLNYSPEYPAEIWQRYEGRCTNMRLLVAQRDH